MDAIAFLPIGPEILLLAGALIVLMVAVTLDMDHRYWAAVAFTALVVAVALSWIQWLRVDELGPQLNFTGPAGDNPMVVTDHFSAFAGMVTFSVSGFGLLAAWPLVKRLQRRGAEFVALVLLASAGLHAMAFSSNLILLFIALESASISLYVIAGIAREQPNSDEAAMKYFLLGSFASALFLYGVALAFSATGSTSIYGGIADWVTEFAGQQLANRQGIVLAAVALMVVGLGFKVSAAPFHQWAPDVYQGAPGGAVGLMAAGVKVAGFAAMARVLTVGFAGAIEVWRPAVAAIAALSIVTGTVFAIAQSDIKRMLAYSGVAHAGYILTALVLGVGGVPAMWFYVSTYAFQLLGAFTVAAVVGGTERGTSALHDYRGLGSRAPGLALPLAILMISLGGIPATAGFVGKVGVFAAAIEAGYLWLAILGVIAAVGGLYFYLRVIVLMYFQQPVLAPGPGTAHAEPEPSEPERVVIAVSLAVTVVFGLIPWPLLELVRHAVPAL